MSAEFTSLTLESDYGRKYFTTTANKTTNLASTNSTKLGNFPAILPPKEEAVEIVKRCKKIASEFEHLEVLELNVIKFLNEFKQTLIALAVTGKIKV